MITFLDEKDVEHGALATIKVTNAVNGERSLTGEIESGDYVLSNIERGWRLRFDDEFYVVTYAKPIDDGKTTHVTFDAVHQFFWDFDKSSVHEQLNDGSHTFLTYLDFIFTGSDYTYTIDPLLKVYAFEKQSFGYKSRLKLFNDVITSSGVEFQVNGKVVRILEKTGTDLSTVVRKNFNMNELGIEKNIGDFVTYQKGFGAWVDENDHTKGRLVTEYTSPLASVYGKLEAEPLVDERYTQADNMVAALKANVDNSYSISVRLDMEDLTRAGYDYTQPRAGDYIMAINETLDFQEKIRIVSFTSEYDVTGQLIKHEVTCNDIGAVKKLSASYSLTKEQAQNASATVVKAVEMANKALVSADGKNTVYFGTEFPEDEPKGELHKGDSLYLTVGDTTKMYYWTGADWEELPIVNDVKAFQDQINDELKDIPDREEVESTINQKIATSKAEIKTQIDTAKSQAESNAKSYADEINQATAEVADRANAAADALKTDLAKVKTDLTATTSTANSAETSASEAKQQITTVANNLSKAKTDLTDSIAAVDSKADTIQSNVSKAQSDIQTVASNLTKAKQDLQTSISSVDSKADGIQSNLTKAKTDLQSSISSVDSKTDTVQANLTKAKTDLQASIATVDGKTDTVQTNLTKAKNDLQTQINAVPGQISSAVSEVEGKIPTSVGGRNLLLKANQGKTNWRWNVASGQTTAEDYDVDGVNAVKMTRTSDGSPSWYYIQYQGLIRNLIEPDTQYTLSFDVYPSQNVTFTTTLMRGDGIALLTNSVRMNPALANQWTKVSCVLTTKATLPDDLSQVVYLQGMPVAKDNYLIIKNIKLEKGNIATDWSPAIEDTASQIDSLSSQIQQTSDGMTLLATKTELNNAKSELNTSIAAVNTKATNLQTDVSNLNASLSNTSKTVQAHATTLTNQAKELQNQANQLTAQAEAQDALTTRVATVETTVNGTKSTVSELSKTVASNTNNITSVTNRTKTVETDLTSAKTSISELQTNLSSTQTGLTNLTKRTKDVEDDLSGTKTTLTELSQTVADDGESITGLTTKTATIESSVNGLKTSLTNTQKDLTSVTTRTKNVEDDLAGTKTSLTSLSATVAADGQTITSLSNKTKTIESNVDGLTTSLSNTQKDLTSVTNRTKTVEDTLDGTRTELAELQETVDTTNSDLASVTQRTSTVESDLSGTKTSLSNLTKIVSDDGKTITSLSSQTKTIESTVNGLSTSLISTQQDLAGITTRTKNVEDDLSGTKTELAELQTTVDTTNTDLANVTKRTKTVEDSLAGTKTSLSSLSQTVANNGQDITSLSSRTKTVEDSVSGLTTTMTSVQQTLTSTTSRTKAVEDSLNGTKTTLAQVQSTANANSQKTATLETGLNGLNAKFETLKIGSRNYFKNSKSRKYYINGTETQDVRTYIDDEFWQNDTRFTKNYVRMSFDIAFNPALSADFTTNVHFSASPWYNCGGVTFKGGTTALQHFDLKFDLSSAASDYQTDNVFIRLNNTLPTNTAVSLENFNLYLSAVVEDYSQNEADIEQKVAEYKQNADQNYASLQTTVQNLNGTVTANKATADQTAQGFSTRIESLETYQSGESTRANQYFESAKTETARQLTAERTAIANDYVAKSTYTSDVTGLRNDLTATTTTANTTKINLASYQASNDQAVASLQSSLQTTNGNVSSLQTKVEAVPGQITSAVSAVEGKIPTEIGSSNLLRKTAVNTDNLKLFFTNNTTISVVEKDGHQVYKLVVSGSSNAGAYFNGNNGYYNLVKDRNYTFSFWVLTNKDKNYNINSLGHIQAVNNNSDKVGNDFMHQHTWPVYSTNVIKANTWTKVWCTFKATSNSYFKPYFWYLNADDEIYIYDMMLNEGKVPLSYTSAIEDTADDISKLNTTLTQTAEGLTQLSTKVDTQGSTITSHTNSINSLNNQINAKVAKSEFDTLSGRVSNAETAITANASEISSKISAVEGKIPTSVGGRNYIKNSEYRKATIWVNDNQSQDEAFDISSAFWQNSNVYAKKIKLSFYYQPSVAYETERKFPVHFRTSPWPLIGEVTYPANTTRLIKYTLAMTSALPANFTANQIFIRFSGNLDKGRYHNIVKVMLEVSDVFSDWSPAPEDTASQINSLSSQIQQTSDGMTLLATKTELNIAKSDLQTGINTAASKADNAQSTANSNAQTISTHTTQISALNTSLQSKVSQSDFDSLSGDVDDLSSELTQTASSITASVSSVETKADNAQATANSAVSKADSNADIISTHTTQISVLNTGLSTKVSQSDFNTLSGRVTTAESNLTATTNQLSSQISSVSERIPKSVGAVNLFKGSRDFSSADWINNSTGVYAEDYQGVKIFKTQAAWGGRSQYFEVKSGEEYVFSAYVKSSAKSDRVTFYLIHTSKQPMATGLVGFDSANSQDAVSFDLTDEYQRIAIKIKITKDGWMMPRLERYNNDAYLFFGGYKLERGNIATDYSPNPEDYDAALTRAKSEIKQTTDAITASVSSVQTAASNAQSTANTAQAGVNTLDSTTVKSASLTIGTDGVVMKAGKSTSDIANAIGSYFSVNQNAINLFSDKISVKGSMIVDGAITSTKIASKSINTAHLNGKIITADVIATGAITADAIKAGAITTDKMTANSINGDRITAGTLDAAKIKAGSITASQIASGTITSSQIATGTISAGNIATGAITTDKIAANSINSDKIVSSGITANVIKGGKLQSLTNTTNFDLDTGKLFYNNNNTGVFRVEDGASTMGLKFSNTAITVNNTSRILSRVILGGDRRETTLDDGKWDQGGFTGIVAETINGVASNEHGQADTLRVIGDNVYFTHSYNNDVLTNMPAQGWKMENYSPFSSIPGSVILKPYGINYRNSSIIAGDFRLDNGDGSGYWLRATINTLKNCFGHILNGGTSSQALNAIRSELNKISGT